MIKELFKGLSYYPKAQKVISENKLWKYIIIPGFMSLFYIMGFVIIAYIFADDVSEYLYPSWLSWEWIQGFVKAFLTVFTWLMFLIVGLLTYKFVILIVFAPIWGYISEVVEFTINGKEAPDFNFKDIMSDILRSLSLTLRNTLWMIMFYIVSILIGLIPLIGPIASFAIILAVQSYYEGVALSDYTLERKRYSVDETISFTKGNKYGIMGIGCGFTLILLIPVFGWFSAPGYGTVAATLATLEKIDTP